MGGLAVAIRNWAGAVVSADLVSTPLSLNIACRSSSLTMKNSLAHCVCGVQFLEIAAWFAHCNLVRCIGPEIWHIEGGRMTHKGKAAVVEDAFADGKTPKGSGTNTPVRSRLQTSAGSAAATPAGTDAEGAGSAPVVRKKKKLTRNQIKAQEERRRIRKLNWLTFGGPKPEDTDSD